MTARTLLQMIERQYFRFSFEMTSEIITTSIVHSKIETNEYTVTPITSSSKRSVVWKHFKQIIDENGQNIPNFFACGVCGKVLKQRGTGTTNFKEHKCMKASNTDQVIPPLSDRKSLLDAATTWVIQDGIPFSKIEGDGFKKFASEIVRISQKFKEPIDLNATLPSRTTISRAVTSIYDRQYNDICEELKNVPFYGITTDMWSDDHKRSSFIGITAHYIFEGHF